MLLFYTYVYRDPRNDEPFYVGKGKNKRALYHVDRSDQHPLTRRLAKLKKAGVAPVIEIIPAIDENHAYFLEECLVEIFGRRNIGTGTLWNLTDGGRGVRGLVTTNETRRTLSEAAIGKKWWFKEGKASFAAESPGEGWMAGRGIIKRSSGYSSARKGQPRTWKGPDHTGKKWWNNGSIAKLDFSAPGPDWKLGRLSRGASC